MQLDMLTDQIFEKCLDKPALRSSLEIVKRNKPDSDRDEQQDPPPAKKFFLGVDLKKFLAQNGLPPYDVTYSSHRNEFDKNLVWTASLSIPRSGLNQPMECIAHASSKKGALAEACRVMLEILVNMDRDGHLSEEENMVPRKKVRLDDYDTDNETVVVDDERRTEDEFGTLFPVA